MAVGDQRWGVESWFLGRRKLNNDNDGRQKADQDTSALGAGE